MADGCIMPFSTFNRMGDVMLEGYRAHRLQIKAAREQKKLAESRYIQQAGRGLRKPVPVKDFLECGECDGWKLAELSYMYGDKHLYPVWGERIFWFSLGFLAATCLGFLLSTLVK